MSLMETLGLNDDEESSDVNSTETEVSANAEEGSKTVLNEVADTSSVGTNDEEAEQSVSEDAKTDSRTAKKSKKSVTDELMEERGYRTRIQAELREAREQIKTFDGLKEQFNSLRKELKGSAEDSEVTYDSDPLLYLKRSLEKLQETIDGHTNKAEEKSTKADLDKYYTELWQRGQRSVADFRSENADIDDAITFLHKSQETVLKRLGYSDVQVNEYLSKETLGLLEEAYKNGQNPAAILYDIAKLRGYVAKGDVQKDLGKISKGVSNNKTLSSASGKTLSGDGKVGLQDITNMSDEEFDKYWQSNVVPKGRRIQ